jgi:threonyl-tRNA synthetase
LGTVYRYELSGALHGMVRVRGFTIDDAHIFCTPEQLPREITDCIRLSKLVLEAIGMRDYRVRIGLRDVDSAKYIGDGAVWDEAERALREAVQASGMNSSEEPGEAAFYGPKVDFIVKDAIGREWQLGTVQVDYNLPRRFKLKYVGIDNAEHEPIMVHRALFGSLERFVGILIEHFAGAFPLWLSPIQVRVCSISEKSAEYAELVHDTCRQTGLRVELDNSDDRIGAKIRNATLEKIPYILVVGEQEVAQQTVNVRTRDGKQFGNFTLPDFLAACAIEISNRGDKAPDVAGQTASA